MSMKIFFYDVAPLYDEENFRTAYNSVSEKRKEKTDAFRFQKDKCLSLGAELVLYKALDELKIPADKRAVATDEKGKPFLAEYKNVFFNLSHSGKIAMCVTAESPVGCDVEEIGKYGEPIAKNKFAPSESRYVLSASTEDERAKRFFRVWTMKESFLKATGVGIAFSLEAFSVVDEKGKALPVNYRGKLFEIENIDLPGYASAVCIQRD